MDYYSLFWGPGAISMITEPRGSFMCRTSTLVVLADYDPFHGLLLTGLGSLSDFHDYRTLGCVYVSVINTHSFGRFWPVSWTISFCFRVTELFPLLTNFGVVYVSVINSHGLADSCPFHSLFWGPEVISTINEPRGAFACRSSTLVVWPIL